MLKNIIELIVLKLIIFECVNILKLFPISRVDLHASRLSFIHALE